MTKYDNVLIRKGSKIGAAGLASDNIIPFCDYLADRGTGFAGFYWSTDSGWVRGAASRMPEAYVIGRYIWDGEGGGGNSKIGWSQSQFDEAADIAIRLIEEHIATDLWLEETVTWWTPWNEPGLGSVEEWVAFAKLMDATIRRANASPYKIKLGMPNFCAGKPEYDEFLAMAETGVFRRLHEAGGILTVHEGTLDTYDPTYCVGDTIPGAPEGIDGGCMNLRLAFWNHILEQTMGSRLPIAVTEWYCYGPGEHEWLGADDDTLANALAWYDEQVSKIWNVIGVFPFVLGGQGAGWSKCEWSPTYEARVLDDMVTVKGRQNAMPSDQELESEGYDRVVIIADPTYMNWQALDHAYNRGRGELRTVTPSWNDAVQKVEEKPSEWLSNTVYAGMIPQDQQQAYVDWVNERDPETDLVFDNPVTDEPVVDDPLSILGGLHDTTGGEWMVNNSLTGCCLALVQVQRSPNIIDVGHLASNGIVVIGRINWGYADGSGSLPVPDLANTWVDAVVETINRSQGVAGWIVGNEDNNPSEWPNSYPNPSFIVSPEYYIDLYNRIESRTSGALAPTALDPYNVVAGEFGQPSDPKDWAQAIYAGVNRFNFVALHAKTQGNDPSQCWSDQMFTDPPLIGRHMHLGAIKDQRDWIPSETPVYVTELNPQVRSDGQLGWDHGNAEWVRESVAYVKAQPWVEGYTFYRYELAGGGQEGFALCNKPQILTAIKEVLAQ